MYLSVMLIILNPSLFPDTLISEAVKISALCPTGRQSRSALLTDAQVKKHTQPFYGPFFRDHPGEPVPEENFWTLWCKGRLTEADTQIKYKVKIA